MPGLRLGGNCEIPIVSVSLVDWACAGAPAPASTAAAATPTQNLFIRVLSHESRVGQVYQRQQVRPGKLGPAMEPDLAGLRGELVPRTHRQAVVAAEDPVADGGPELRRNDPLMLDRQIGDAAARIQLVRRREGVGRADVQAAAAAPAMVGLGGV